MDSFGSSHLIEDRDSGTDPFADDEPEDRSLEDAISHAMATTWMEARDGGKVMRSHCRRAALTLCAEAGRDTLMVSEVSKPLIRRAVQRWRTEKLKPGTINRRLACLSALGVSVRGCRVKPSKQLKWWLTAEGEEAIYRSPTIPGLMKDYVRFTTRSGFRVEENLRIRRRDFVGLPVVVGMSMTVRGTKTAMASNTTLPLHPEAAEVVARRLSLADPDAPLFDVTYAKLAALWQDCRELLGEQDNHLATLRALRRSAARYLTANGMPLPIVQYYLRHENSNTTLGYLKLTGGYHEQEIRRWF